MSKTIKVIHNINELANEKGIIEVVYRRANKRFKEFVKYAIEKEPTNNDIYQLAQKISKKIGKADIKIENIEKYAQFSQSLSKFNAVLGVANLCTTVVGFAIINKNLNKINNSVQEAIDVIKNTNDINTNYKFQEVIAEYKEMLDKKRYGEKLSEDEYRKLIDFENNVLRMLISGLMLDTHKNKLDVLYAILSLASMMSLTMCDFDEIYYYNHKDHIKDENYFHSSRNDWLNTFDMIIEKKMIEQVQDVCFIDENLNQRDTDLFVSAFKEKILTLKQDIIDTNALLLMNKDMDSYDQSIKGIDKDIINYINSELSKEQYSDEFKTSVIQYEKELQMN